MNNELNTKPPDISTINVHLILLSKDHSAILMIYTTLGWRLPVITGIPAHVDGLALFINSRVKEKTGLTSTILTHLHFSQPDNQGVMQFVTVLECLDFPQVLSGLDEWAYLKNVQSMQFLYPQHKSIIKIWYEAWIASDITNRYGDWAAPGWFNEAKAWIHTQLTNIGVKGISNIEQFNLSHNTCILRASANSGIYFLKCLAPHYAPEPLITKLLFDKFPSNIPKIILHNKRQRWMLMEGVSGAPLKKVINVKRWQEAVYIYSMIQRSYLNHYDKILKAGARDTRAAKIRSDITQLQNIIESLYEKDTNTLNKTEVDQLRVICKDCYNLCDAIMAYNLPDTIVHGDFHPMNIFVSEKSFVFLDWSDCCIAHPYLYFSKLFRAINNWCCEMLPYQSIICDTYLESWQDYLSMQESMELLSYCDRLMKYEDVTYIANLFFNKKTDHQYSDAEIIVALKGILKYRS